MLRLIFVSWIGLRSVHSSIGSRVCNFPGSGHPTTNLPKMLRSKISLHKKENIATKPFDIALIFGIL